MKLSLVQNMHQCQGVTLSKYHDMYDTCTASNRTANPRPRGKSSGCSVRKLRWICGRREEVGTFPGSFPELPASHHHQRGMKTPLTAQKRALLPCFWENLTLYMFSKGQKKPFQPCLANGVTGRPGRPCSGDDAASLTVIGAAWFKPASILSVKASFFAIYIECTAELRCSEVNRLHLFEKKPNKQQHKCLDQEGRDHRDQLLKYQNQTLEVLQFGKKHIFTIIKLKGRLTTVYNMPGKVAFNWGKRHKWCKRSVHFKKTENFHFVKAVRLLKWGNLLHNTGALYSQ